ncbi:MAG: hypothetical protein CMD18_04075 [Flavobacteriales bacterium]|nr:hypothetical protein [Flavobacteriales bacterium]
MFQKIIPIILFGCIHLMFLFGVVFHAYSMFYGLGFLPLLAYFLFKYTPATFNLKEYLFTLLSFGVGYVLTTKAVDVFSVTPVYASALVGMIFSFFRLKHLPLFSAVVYSGSFAGMVAGFHIKELYIACLIIIIGGNLFYFLKDNFNGLGGKLGSIGFGAMLLPVIIGVEKSFFSELYDNTLSIDPIGELSSNKTLLFTIIIAFFGTILTYWLNNKRGYGPIKASAIPTFIIAIPLQLIPVSGFIALVPIVFFGATFVGMSNDKTIGWMAVITSSVVYAIIFHFIHPYFNGYGGALGATACLSCLMGVLLQKAFNSQTVRV